MTNSLKSQIELSADASGVEAGVSKAKKSLASLGVTAAAEGQKAAAGIDKIGTGGEKAAKKVEKDTRNINTSLERTIATLEAGGRASSKYFESLASQRGADLEFLAPNLNKLRELEARLDDSNKALQKGGVQLNAYGISARQTAAAMRGVPAQLTDIAVGLQSGQAPLTVLLQQGGQLKDMFGGVAPAAKALGGAIVGLINPLTITAGAVLALGVAYNKGGKEADNYAKALILSGNAAGQTVDGLADMAARIDGVIGTQATAAAALAEFAANGNIAGASLERFATVAIRMEKTTGQAVSKTVEQFAALGKSPVEAAVKLNESTNFLTESVYKQIRALDAQGKTAEAAAVAQKAYADAMDSRLGEINDRLGSVEKAWIGVKNVAAEAWDAMVDIQRPQTLQSQLDKAARTLESLQAQLGQAANSGLNTDALAKEVELQQQRVDSLRESQRLLGTVADRQRASTEQVKARAAFDKEADKYLDGRVQMEREIARVTALAAKAGATRVEQERLIAAIRDKYKAGEAQDAIIAARIAPDVEAAEALVQADFKKAQDEATEQIKAIAEGAAKERQQVLESITESYAQTDREQQAAGGFLDGKFVGNLKKVEDAARQLGLTFSSAFEDSIVAGKELGEVFQSLEQDVIRIAARKLITEPLANSLSGAFAGLFSGVAGSAVSSFDGGGSTGSGSRSGGLDGKGGFLAMLHPRETVVDHTRGQTLAAGSGQPISIVNHYNIDSRTDRAEVLQLMERTSRQNDARLVDQLTRQRRLA